MAPERDEQSQNPGSKSSPPHQSRVPGTHDSRLPTQDFSWEIEGRHALRRKP
jgi:hypothetical protein